MASGPHVFKPPNTRKGMRGYVRHQGMIQHKKSSKLGTQKRRVGKPIYKNDAGPIGSTLRTVKRKAKRGLFGLF